MRNFLKYCSSINSSSINTPDIRFPERVTIAYCMMKDLMAIDGSSLRQCTVPPAVQFSVQKL
jgi:hypothetical protein